MQNFSTAGLRPVERARVLAEEDAEEAAQGGRRVTACAITSVTRTRRES